MAYASSPGILVNDRGEDGTNSALPFYSCHSCSVVNRGQRKTYMLSPSTAFTPLIQGGFFLFASALNPPYVGGVHSSFYPPRLGGNILPAALSMGAGMKPTRCPPVEFIYSSLGGQIMPAVALLNGGRHKS